MTRIGLSGFQGADPLIGCQQTDWEVEWVSMLDSSPFSRAYSGLETADYLKYP